MENRRDEGMFRREMKLMVERHKCCIRQKDKTS